MASQGSLKGLGMAFDISLNLQLTNCSDDEAANDELCRLIDYCEARMHKVTPSVMMQALAEAIVGIAMGRSQFHELSKAPQLAGPWHMMASQSAGRMICL